MNFPLSVSNREPNNVLMSPEDIYDRIKACTQWMKLYQRIAREALVYVLPGDNHLQDLPFVANLGCHIGDNLILLSRFTSNPRIGEEAVGRKFFESFDYRVRQPSECWEGEADLKWVNTNIYVGGTGQRSTREAFQWMRKQFGMDIIDIELTDPKLYHLDCVFLPLGEKALVNTSALLSSDIDKLQKIVEIIPVPEQYRYDGWTNALMLGETLLHSAISSADEYEKFMKSLGINVECFDLTEFEKSGADLSCLVMHLGRPHAHH
jgi:N-dimethylarginine dimethylaminohydrolase